MIQKSVIQLNYEKRKNTKLFEQFRDSNINDFVDIQNYIPIYSKFFELNDTNYNSFNLNHNIYLNEISKSDDSTIIYKLKNNNTEIVNQNVFIKYAPVLDPFKYFIGKYNFSINDCILPKNIQDDIHPDLASKLYDVNNSAYVDGFFSYLSSEILNKYGFIHGIEFYGMYFGIKKDFKVNVLDDIDYLCKSDYFNTNNGILFSVEDYTIASEHTDKLPKIHIDHTKKANISANSIKDNLFEDIFDLNTEDNTFLTLEELDDDIFALDTINHTTSLKSTTTCSSRTSFTLTESDSDSESESESESISDNDSGSLNSNSNSNCSYSQSDDEKPIFATIPKFPVNVICLEKCEDTLDNLIINDGIKTIDEWFALLMQIIMTLISYQKCFSFTHNDLHTNNIMYNNTEDKFLYYCYNNKYYKVPTYGRIFKIIDFGRSIYKMNNRTFCSDSFKKGEDAATQYNIEPYFNDKKPRIEPNYSFDLCRLACSIFDYIVEDIGDLQNIDKCSPIVKLIVEWCLDDNGLNVLYKSNGDERYEEFKLYKMIARSVHNHTPQNQLERPEFSKFCINKKKIPNSCMNIDLMPIC